MDSTDRAILKCLKANSRMTASAIAAEVNMSVSSVAERIKKLEETGIIRKYTVCLDADKAGGKISAYLGVTFASSASFERFRAFVENTDSVLCCDYVSSEPDFILKVQTDGTEALRELQERLYRIEGVSKIKTFVVLKNVKDDFSALP